MVDAPSEEILCGRAGDQQTARGVVACRDNGCGALGEDDKRAVLVDVRDCRAKNNQRTFALARGNQREHGRHQNYIYNYTRSD
jgi:hypothetical protein